MRCPSCGARNVADAAWCTQCFTRLDEPAEAPAAAPEAPTAPTAPTGSTARASVAHPDVRTTDDGIVEWCCATCGSWTPVDRHACQVCGLRMGTPTVTPAATPPADITTRAVLVPGGGHLALGQRGTGVAILSTVVLWALGAILLTFAALDAGQVPLSGMVLFVGVVGVWAVSARDARVLASGRRGVLLQGAALVWVIAGVTGLLVLTLLVASLQAAA